MLTVCRFTAHPSWCYRQAGAAALFEDWKRSRGSSCKHFKSHQATAAVTLNCFNYSTGFFFPHFTSEVKFHGHKFQVRNLSRWIFGIEKLEKLYWDAIYFKLDFFLALSSLPLRCCTAHLTSSLYRTNVPSTGHQWRTELQRMGTSLWRSVKVKHVQTM